MKKLKIFICAIFLTFALAACSSNDKTKTEKQSMFCAVEQSYYYKVVYHRETKVMYVVSYSSYNKGTFTILVNPDGSPMLYDEKEE